MRKNMIYIKNTIPEYIMLITIFSILVMQDLPAQENNNNKTKSNKKETTITVIVFATVGTITGFIIGAELSHAGSMAPLPSSIFKADFTNGMKIGAAVGLVTGAGIGYTLAKLAQKKKQAKADSLKSDADFLNYQARYKNIKIKAITELR